MSAAGAFVCGWFVLIFVQGIVAALERRKESQ